MKFYEPIHAGPVMRARRDLPRHCETVLPNQSCPYHALGCLGCTIASWKEIEISDGKHVPPAQQAAPETGARGMETG